MFQSKIKFIFIDLFLISKIYHLISAINYLYGTFYLIKEYQLNSIIINNSAQNLANLLLVFIQLLLLVRKIQLMLFLAFHA